MHGAIGMILSTETNKLMKFESSSSEIRTLIVGRYMLNISKAHKYAKSNSLINGRVGNSILLLLFTLNKTCTMVLLNQMSLEHSTKRINMLL